MLRRRNNVQTDKKLTNHEAYEAVLSKNIQKLSIRQKQLLLFKQNTTDQFLIHYYKQYQKMLDEDIKFYVKELQLDIFSIQSEMKQVIQKQQYIEAINFLARNPQSLFDVFDEQQLFTKEQLQQAKDNLQGQQSEHLNVLNNSNLQDDDSLNILFNEHVSQDDILFNSQISERIQMVHEQQNQAPIAPVEEEKKQQQQPIEIEEQIQPAKIKQQNEQPKEQIQIPDVPPIAPIEEEKKEIDVDLQSQMTEFIDYSKESIKVHQMDAQFDINDFEKVYQIQKGAVQSNKKSYELFKGKGVPKKNKTPVSIGGILIFVDQSETEYEKKMRSIMQDDDIFGQDISTRFNQIPVAKK